MKRLMLLYFSVIFVGCSRSDVKNAQQAPSSPLAVQPLQRTVDAFPHPPTATPASIAKELFPTAPKTVRHLHCFRSFPRGISMYAVVNKCGRPDEEIGSGLGYFIYHLEDRSTVIIRYSEINHIEDIEHVDNSGKASSLIVEK
jgi:hypothetical protein